MRKLGLAFVFLITACASDSGPAGVEGVSWVQLATPSDGVLRAAYAKPPGPGPFPAVVFNHGTGVRARGHEGGIARGETDVRRFVRALADAGYVGLAPLRTVNATSAYPDRGRFAGTEAQWSEVIASGIRTVDAALTWLAGQPEVDRTRLAAIGFSEGGNVTLWSMLDRSDVRGAVLISPATIEMAPRYALREAAAAEAVARLRAPVMLTVGDSDLPSIRGVAASRLGPNLTRHEARSRVKLDYPGDHASFYAPRADHWPDVLDFLRPLLTR
ncbi:MAG: hypothetical protein FJX46_15275 [Alphaproteobacteria bacterium]|nr:hypothetical protein [Alphaproteobacteria bacterium]